MTNGVALDIETTGLGPADTITCVAVCAGDWWLVWTVESDDLWSTSSHIKEILDAAPLIYAYNGATFDIPFMQRCFGYSDETVGRWMAKLVDPLYAARAVLGCEACPKLAEVLALNGLEPKTASGADAIVMAREGRWKELVDYCVKDTALTRELLDRENVNWVKGLVYCPYAKHLWKQPTVVPAGLGEL